MDCGPASLKCLLEGFGKHVSYGRLREACQTGIDGTSIDTMETVANQLGLAAEQIMIPADHVLLPEAKSLPALVVVKLPNGLTHFVVAWKRHGNTVQIMDPAVGRRWIGCAQFVNELYSHIMQVPAADWRDFAASDDFQRVLRQRMVRLGLSSRERKRLSDQALEQQSWLALAALDAAARLVDSLIRTGGMRRGGDCARLLRHFCAHSALIPARYWSVRSGPTDENGEEQLFLRGAVLVRVQGKRSAAEQPLSPELAAAVEERPVSPGRELLRFLWQSGRTRSSILTLALAAAAGAVLIEALLFRGLFDVAANLGLAGQRMGAMAAVLIFGLALLLMELSVFAGAARLGRQIENRLRIAFLTKIPKLGDRYFQSRLTSDMAERSHATHRLRHLPDLARQMLRATFELCATAAGIMWLEPSSAPFVLLTAAAALVPAFGTQSILAERDLRVRSHAAGLTRFYLDAMLGLLAIRAHGAERSVRREHEKLMGEWAHAALRLQRTVVTTEAFQLVAMFGLVASLLLVHPLQGSDIGRVLLVVYWALNLPVLGQDVGALARQYPYYRNLTLRLLDPLGAPEEAVTKRLESATPETSSAPVIEFRNVSAQASGHTILEEVNLRIESGSHVAIVGPSGAGKSSLVGILLGWLKPSRGEVLVDDTALDCERLREVTAWVDPAVQLWNRSLLSNLSYGSDPKASEVGHAVDAALLRGVLETLPKGLQTKLGEGGALVSGGEGQRVRLARATLRRETRLVILDEPFRGLDREKRRELLARAREFWRGCTMLCVTHDLSDTQAFDRVLVVERGRIVEEGAPRELSRSPESRYAQLLDAENAAHAGLWSASLWRRIRVHSGRIVEEVPRAVEERRPETEVA